MNPSRLALLGALVLAGLALSACSDLSGSTLQQVRGWAKGANYVQDAQTIDQDLASMRAGIGLRDLKGVRTACAAFGVDAATLQGELPTPVPEITDALDHAMSSFYKASVACFAAGSFDDAHFATYRRHLAQGTPDFERAKSLLAKDGVR